MHIFTIKIVGLHDGPLGNATRPGQQGNSSVYQSQLRNITSRLHSFCSGSGNCQLLFALTSAMICDVLKNNNVAMLDAEARDIMSSFGIPTVDLQVSLSIDFVAVFCLSLTGFRSTQLSKSVPQQVCLCIVASTSLAAFVPTVRMLCSDQALGMSGWRRAQLSRQSNACLTSICAP